MMLVTTRTGTTYEVDTEASTVRRTGGAAMRRDGEAVHYHSVEQPQVGQPLVMVLRIEDGVRTIRVTTEVVSIEEAE